MGQDKVRTYVFKREDGMEICADEILVTIYQDGEAELAERTSRPGEEIPVWGEPITGEKTP